MDLQILESAVMAQRPQIDYRHVLAELCVNKKDPCEIVRELISNSYDAEARCIKLFTIPNERALIFFDNGHGLSEHKNAENFSAWEAFFSIGKSTKTFGKSTGYKCQGSKLCFASSRFALITRCNDDDESWRTIIIDNPSKILNTTFDIDSSSDSEPWTNFFAKIFHRRNDINSPILKYLDQHFFRTEFRTGTMIIIIGLEIQDFIKYYGTHEKDESYIWNYIRFNTKHGDVRLLKSSQTGFQIQNEAPFKESNGCRDNCKLSLWCSGAMEEVPPGYPYIVRPDKVEKDPTEVNSLRDGKFVDRIARKFSFGDRHYCLVLAIDGNRRALREYPQLGRAGNSGCGIRFVDQRGVFLCSQGIKICSYNSIFEHPKLEDRYGALAASESQLHFVFMIDGVFELVTDRNSLSGVSLALLQDPLFIEKIKAFLDFAYDQNGIFRKLVERLNNDAKELRREQQAKQLSNSKEKIKQRRRFKVHNIDQLKGKWILAPSIGEEHWVGALYALFSHLVPTDSKYIDMWRRPLTFSARGIDSIGIGVKETSIQDELLRSIEYKYSFSVNDIFNHPLSLTDVIICWELADPKQPNMIVQDEYDCYGQVSELGEFGYSISPIQSRDGAWQKEKVEVICLDTLMQKTFKISDNHVPPQSEPAKKKKSSKK